MERTQCMPRYAESYVLWVGWYCDTCYEWIDIDDEHWRLFHRLHIDQREVLVDQHQGLVDQHQVLVDQHPGLVDQHQVLVDRHQGAWWINKSAV